LTKLLTNSEMAVWRRCRRRWWLGQYRGLRRRSEVEFNRPTGIGNRVHDALADYYDPELRRDPVTTVNMTEARDLETAPQHEDDIRKECGLARLMVEGYVEWLAETGADQALTLVEAERARKAPLGADRDVTLLSKLDAKVHHDEFGQFLNLEHKTVGSLKQHLPELRINSQVLTEHLVEFLALLEEGYSRDEAQGRAGGVLFNLLLKSKRTARAKGPFYDRIHVKHSMSELRHHWMHVVAIADEIRATETALDAGGDPHFLCPPSPNSDCSWSCPFFRLCPNVDDDADHEGQIADQFEVRDPLERYAGILDEGDRAA